jgi:hypothetical protein
MDVKQAVAIATTYFRSVFPDYTRNLELEEVEFLPHNESWLITLGYDKEKPEPTGVLRSFGQQSWERDYKVVHVDAKGTPLSVKMREAS